MSNGIIVFGAGGRTGRTAVAEALRRGHRVTAVVRDPAKYADLAGPEVRVVAGDVTDADAVAALAVGHDAAIAAVYDPAAPMGDFFVRAVRALLAGLSRAGVGRLVWVGLASVLPTASGEPLMDTPDYPQEYRAFFLAHGEGNAALRSWDGAPEWVVLSPAGDFDHEGVRTGNCRVAPADAQSRVSYPDFAIALLDEIDAPKLRGVHVGIEDGR
ncbi:MULTISPECIES: NAD(P)H-binding protein [unclassified Embleya]|uniref:NAD(P)-dependent oxidoreductase n=1 Tax=unclassified Embleya TaxID=2699296 RepID=UPI00340D656B